MRHPLRSHPGRRHFACVRQVAEFQRKFVIVFLSYHWLALTTPDPNSVHFETMCAAVRRGANIANVSLDRVFVGVDPCSIPQDRREFTSLTHTSCPRLLVLDSPKPSIRWSSALHSFRLTILQCWDPFGHTETRGLALGHAGQFSACCESTCTCV